MAKARKDKKGRALRKGECQRDNYYIYQFYDLNHQRRVVYAKDLPELREKERRIQQDMNDGINAYQGHMITLNEAFERQIEMRIGLRETTKIFYKEMYDRYVRNIIGNYKVATIRYSDIKKYYLFLMDSRGLKLKSVELTDAIINPVFEMLVRDQIIRSNPIKGVLGELKRAMEYEEKPCRALNMEQQRSLISYVANNPVFCIWYPLIAVMLGTGCRIGEVLGLRWCDLDMKEKVINVDHALIYRKGESGKQEYHIVKPKTRAGVRKIPMMNTVYEILIDYKESCKKFSKKEYIDGYTDFIFLNERGKVFRPPYINIILSRICEEYNKEEHARAIAEKREIQLMPHFSCHTLRHTFCARLCENEVNVKVIQELMGHSSIKITMDIYAEITEEKKKKECIIKLEDIFEM